MGHPNRICELPPLPEEILATMPQITMRHKKMIELANEHVGLDVPPAMQREISAVVWDAARKITEAKLKLRHGGKRHAQADRE